MHSFLFSLLIHEYNLFITLYQPKHIHILHIYTRLHHPSMLALILQSLQGLNTYTIQDQHIHFTLIFVSPTFKHFETHKTSIHTHWTHGSYTLTSINMTFNLLTFFFNTNNKQENQLLTIKHSFTNFSTPKTCKIHHTHTNTLHGHTHTNLFTF